MFPQRGFQSMRWNIHVENTCSKYLRGGQPSQRIKDPDPFSNFVTPCWHYFWLLGACWASSVLLVALFIDCWRFLRILDRSGLNFGWIMESPGRVLKVPGALF